MLILMFSNAFVGMSRWFFENILRHSHNTMKYNQSSVLKFVSFSIKIFWRIHQTSWGENKEFKILLDLSLLQYLNVTESTKIWCENVAHIQKNFNRQVTIFCFRILALELAWKIIIIIILYIYKRRQLGH